MTRFTLFGRFPYWAAAPKSCAPTLATAESLRTESSSLSSPATGKSFGLSPLTVRTKRKFSLPIPVRFAASLGLPSGRRILYSLSAPGAAGMSFKTVALDGASPASLYSGAQLNPEFPTVLWGPDGRIFFAQNEENKIAAASMNLWTMPVDPDTGAFAGQPTKISYWDNINAIPVGISSDGKQLLVLKSRYSTQMLLAELKSDGRSLGNVQPVTATLSTDMAGGWALDSKSFLFSSNRNKGVFRMYRRSLGTQHDENPDFVGDATIASRVQKPRMDASSSIGVNPLQSPAARRQRTPHASLI